MRTPARRRDARKRRRGPWPSPRGCPRGRKEGASAFPLSQTLPVAVRIVFISPMRLRQRDLHQQLRQEETASRERIVTLVRPFDPARLNEHPEPKGWSVAQVLE